MIAGRPWPPGPRPGLFRLQGEKDVCVRQELGLRAGQPQPGRKPAVASGAVASPLRSAQDPGWADRNQGSWGKEGRCRVGGGTQEVEAAPGSQPDSCPEAPAHPSLPTTGSAPHRPLLHSGCSWGVAGTRAPGLTGVSCPSRPLWALHRPPLFPCRTPRALFLAHVSLACAWGEGQPG